MKGLRGIDVLRYNFHSCVGNFLHIGWHMCVAVCGSALMGMPYALSLLGWPVGLLLLIMAYLSTLWASWLMAKLCRWNGKQYIRYRDLAESLLGTFWGRYFVWFCQWTTLIGATVGVILQAGLSMQSMYQLGHPGGTDFKLWHFISLMGCATAICMQVPTLHSQRILNGLAMANTALFALMAVILSSYQGLKYKPAKDYGVHTSPVDKFFGVLTGVTLLCFAFGNILMPEIAATAKEPFMKTMRGGIAILYAVLAWSYVPVAIAGYWAYGYELNVNGAAFLPQYCAAVSGPTWLVYATLASTLINAAIFVNLYNASLNEYVESKMYDRAAGLWSLRNWGPRTLFRTGYIFCITFIACMIPFFGDILGLIGAAGVAPLGFVYPYLLAMKAGLLRSRTEKFLAIFFIGMYIFIGVGGTVAAGRGIIMSARAYKLFANMGVLDPQKYLSSS